MKGKMKDQKRAYSVLVPSLEQAVEIIEVALGSTVEIVQGHGRG